MDMLTVPAYHSPILKGYAAGLIVAAATYGLHSKQAASAADELVAALIQADYKEFKLLNLLSEVDNELAEDRIGGEEFAKGILEACYRSCYRANEYQLWGPEEYAYYNFL